MSGMHSGPAGTDVGPAGTDADPAETERNDQTERLERVVIRFAGDSGDGMQLTGDRFTSAAAAFGNDLATLPNFPAEIRAPRAASRESRPSRCTSPTTTSSPPETGPMCWWR